MELRKFRQNLLYEEKQKDSINLINTCKVTIFAKKNEILL